MSRIAYWPAVLLFAVLVAAKFNPQTGFTNLIRFGETWQDRRLGTLEGLPLATVRSSSGYDGQFYATLALDPLLRRADLAKSLDVPDYRARRILGPITAAIIGAGRPWWVLQAYALLNVVCWLALAWLLYRENRTEGWTGFARWFACMFSVGVLDSVRQSLVDLPALLLLFLAIRAAIPSRTTSLSTLWLALACLTKETSLLGAAAIHGKGFFHKPARWHAMTGMLLVSLPIGLWAIYVHLRLGAASPGNSMENFSWPLMGLLAEARICLDRLLGGDFDGRYLFGLIAIVGLAVQLSVLWLNPGTESPLWRTGVAYSLLLPFLGLWVWSGYWAACRAVLPMTLAFNLLLPANRAFWPLWSIGNLTFLHGLWRFL